MILCNIARWALLLVACTRMLAPVRALEEIYAAPDEVIEAAGAIAQ